MDVKLICKKSTYYDKDDEQDLTVHQCRLVSMTKKAKKLLDNSIGAIVMTYKHKDKQLWLNWIHTKQTVRGNTFGFKMICSIIRYLDYPYKYIFLLSESPALTKFYEKIGFTVYKNQFGDDILRVERGKIQCADKQDIVLEWVDGKRTTDFDKEFSESYF